MLDCVNAEHKGTAAQKNRYLREIYEEGTVLKVKVIATVAALVACFAIVIGGEMWGTGTVKSAEMWGTGPQHRSAGTVIILSPPAPGAGSIAR